MLKFDPECITLRIFEQQREQGRHARFSETKLQEVSSKKDHVVKNDQPKLFVITSKQPIREICKNPIQPLIFIVYHG